MNKDTGMQLLDRLSVDNFTTAWNNQLVIILFYFLFYIS